MLTSGMVALLMAGTISSCKNKAKETTPVTTTTTTDDNAAKPAPVEIAADDMLSRGVQDATKDYPDVTSTVHNGEVTLTGSIERDDLSSLIQSVQALNPKKVINQLTIKE